MAKGATVGTAYVQIIPSTEGISGNISSLLSDEMKNAGDQGGSDLGNNLFTSFLKSNAVMKIANLALEGLQTVAQAAFNFVKDIVENYAEFQQLQGGVQKLYGNMGLSAEEYANMVGKSVDEVSDDWQRLEDAQNIVLENARNAYKTAGMDMNTYMENATSLSASLISSLDGDTVEAAKQTDVAMKAISDNWNTFGGDMQSITNAYQGFAKGQYQMLDNLKLGYGGTKTEMERLIEDANTWAEENGKAADLTIDSFSDVVTAIEYIQEKQQIAGTTARESTETVSGSLNMLKAAWENLKTGLGDPEADVGALVDAVLDAADAALDNLLPVIDQALDGIGELIEKLAPKLEERIPGLIETLTPAIQSALESLIQIGAAALSDLAPVLIQAASDIMSSVLEYLEGEHPIIAGILEGVFMPGVGVGRGMQKWGEIAGDTSQLVYDYYSDGAKKNEKLFNDSYSNIASTVSDYSNSIYETTSENMGLSETSLSDSLSNMISTTSASGAQMYQDYMNHMGDIKTETTSAWNGIDTTISNKCESIKKNSSLESVSKKLSESMKSMKKDTSSSWSSISQDIAKKAGDAKAKSSASFKDMKSTATMISATMKSSLNSTFSKMQSLMTKPFQNAYSSIKNSISRMRSAMHFSWSLPHLKVPHISVSGGVAPYGIGGQGSLPRFSVSWYAKAMENPYLFSDATLIGAGEKGDEMLYGHAALMKDIRAAVSESSGSGVTITNYITVDGAENPEAFAQRLVRQMKMEMRMA